MAGGTLGTTRGNGDDGATGSGGGVGRHWNERPLRLLKDERGRLLSIASHGCRTSQDDRADQDAAHHAQGENPTANRQRSNAQTARAPPRWLVVRLIAIR